MAIDIEPQAPEVGQIEVDGETIAVHWEGYGGGRSLGFKATYRGQLLNGSNLTVIRNAVRRVREDEADKARRQEARQAALKSPLPAVAIRGDKWIERVGVRGRHATTREPLVTFANGAKGSHSSSQLLRDLSVNEYAQVEKVVEAYVAAGAASEGLAGRREYDLIRQYSLRLTASYDATSDLWVVEYGSRTFTASTTYDLQVVIGRYLAVRDYPFTVWQGKVVDLREDDEAQRGACWATAEEAQRYLDAHAVLTARTDELDALRREFRFDLSVFDD